MKKHLPYYYHISPTQISDLSFRVNIREKNYGALQSKEIGWQKKISREDADKLTDLGNVAIFTLISEDNKWEGRNALVERIRREREDDPSSAMVILARVHNHDVTLCVLNVHRSGTISSCPALSSEEECMYSFITPDQEEFDYNIEMMIESQEEDCAEGDSILNNNCGRVFEEKRRQLLHKEVDVTEHVFDYQAHVEIVSATGFTQPNILFSAPFDSELFIGYQILKPGECEGRKDVVLKGSTNKLQSYDVFATSTQFLVRFCVVLICIGFAILHLLGKSIGGDISPAALLSIIPLGLLCQFFVFGRVKVRHVNHQFTLLFSKSRMSSYNDHPVATSQQSATMEMHAYFHHNFGMISLAGSAIVDLPSDPGTYDLNVPTFKPIACSGMNERKCRMQSYYLGTCLSNEVQPTSEPADPSLLSNDDDGLTTRLLSKAGLITDGSGTIHLRVNVMKNYFNGAYNKLDELDPPSQHRVKVQETVDEVLSRVRWNKRVRMSRALSSYSTNAAGRNRRSHYRDVATNEEEEEEKKESDCTSDALQR